MNDRTEERRTPHEFFVKDRENMEVHGVTDVVSFDEQSVVLCTTRGNMEIEGDRLHIHVLNTEDGVVTLDGRIDSVGYYDNDPNGTEPKSGFFGKLFR